MNGRDHAQTSSPVRTATTSGTASAAEASMETISARASGERSTAAWAVPGRSPMSSAKRPRPVSSAAFSTRSIARPMRQEEVPRELGWLGIQSAVQWTFRKRPQETAQGTTDPRSFMLRPARHTRSLTRIGRLFFLYVPRQQLRAPPRAQISLLSRNQPIGLRCHNHRSPLVAFDRQLRALYSSVTFPAEIEA